MKITIYDLLGLIKEDKAPKKIEVDGYILELIDDTTNWKTMYIDEDKDYLFVDYYVTLNDEVEIIEEIVEEDKKIKKIRERDWWGNSATGNEATLKEAVDEIIDVINDMRDKE